MFLVVKLSSEIKIRLYLNFDIFCCPNLKN